MAVTLTDFLLKRIAEDEEWARWTRVAQGEHAAQSFAFVATTLEAPVASPRRVLAECEAKRRIVMLAKANHDAYVHSGAPKFAAAEQTTETVLRALAAPYADHEDYREEWKP